jgi:aspartate 1-decarboxylase
MIKIIRAKLHGIKVTDAALNYHGSISLDPSICQKVGILPMEFVDIWNKNSGARLSTYVIYGKSGSRCCILNGAAARTCQIGDEIIIAASEYVERATLPDRAPQVLTFTDGNHIASLIQYRAERDDLGGWRFSTQEEPYVD